MPHWAARPEELVRLLAPWDLRAWSLEALAFFAKNSGGTPRSETLTSESTCPELERPPLPLHPQVPGCPNPKNSYTETGRLSRARAARGSPAPHHGRQRRGEVGVVVAMVAVDLVMVSVHGGGRACSCTYAFSCTTDSWK